VQAQGLLLDLESVLPQVEVEVIVMQALIMSAAFAGSLGTAWMIQRAILAACLKVLATRR
jgi:hypothetical protein